MQRTAGDATMLSDEVEFVPCRVEHLVRPEHGVVAAQHVQQVRPVRDELRVDLANRCGCCRGAKTKCGPYARAEKAPTADGIHVFFRSVLGHPA
jgi:hypothetical protein